jgi:hypothetical protein|tara:strand:- start:1227 stop:1466 length:240 start_codon:yes stop_codon:yes gene_type:complete
MIKWLTSISQWGIVLITLKNTQQRNGRKNQMSVMENEIIKENLLDMHYEWLVGDGWPDDAVETYNEAVRRAQQEWERMY